MKENAGKISPPIDLLDTSRVSVEETAQQVGGGFGGRWVGWEVDRVPTLSNTFLFVGGDLIITVTIIGKAINSMFV
jgi:hypothetical protein